MPSVCRAAQKVMPSVSTTTTTNRTMVRRCPVTQRHQHRALIAVLRSISRVSRGQRVELLVGEPA